MKFKNVLFIALIAAIGCSSPAKQDGEKNPESKSLDLTNNLDASKNLLVEKYANDFVKNKSSKFDEGILKYKGKLTEVSDSEILQKIPNSESASKVYFFQKHAQDKNQQMFSVLVCKEYMDDPFDIVKTYCMIYDKDNKYIDHFPMMAYEKYPAGVLKEKSYGEFSSSSKYVLTEEITGEDIDGNDYTTKTITEYEITTTGKTKKKEIPADKSMANATIKEVSNISEFLKAIGSNTIIKLAKGNYNLADGFAKNIQSNHFEYVDAFNNGELVIYNVDNFKIIGSSTNRTESHVFTHPENGPVLVFRGCKNIQLENFKAGHQPNASECQQGVFVFEEVEKVQIKNCDIYGCGKEGITATNTKNLTCNNSHIYECSASLMQLSDVESFHFNKCKFSKTHGGVYMELAKNIDFTNCEFTQNQANNLFEAATVDGLNLKSNKINKNMAYLLFSFEDYKNVSITDNEIVNNDAEISTDECILETSKNTIKGNHSLENGD